MTQKISDMTFAGLVTGILTMAGFIILHSSKIIGG